MPADVQWVPRSLSPLSVRRWTAAADVIMATQDVEVELQEVLIDTSAADPGPSGRTLVSVLYVCV